MTAPVAFDSVPVQHVDEWLTRLERWVNPETDGYTDAERIATLRAVLYNVRYELGRVP